MDLISALVIVNIIVSAIGPIVTSIGYFITHIKKSSCCDNNIEMQDLPPPITKTNI
jgi:hypothetical protein